jgi:hypothetical protein
MFVNRKYGDRGTDSEFELQIRSLSPDLRRGCRDVSQGWSEATPLESAFMNQRTSKRCEAELDTLPRRVEAHRISRGIGLDRMGASILCLRGRLRSADPLVYLSAGVTQLLQFGSRGSHLRMTGVHLDPACGRFPCQEHRLEWSPLKRCAECLVLLKSPGLCVPLRCVCHPKENCKHCEATADTP